jgi:hypothetical protein
MLRNSIEAPLGTEIRMNASSDLRATPAKKSYHLYA